MKASGMDRAEMMSTKKLPSSKVVAEYGYDAMMRGKLVAVHGFGNRVLSCITKFVPRKTLLNMMYKMMRKAE